MGAFDWINDMSLTVPDGVATAKTRATGSRKQRNPEKADLRIFKDGGVFPSAALVSKFNLEYHSKDDDDQGYGFDIIDTDKFVSYFVKLPRRAILISPVDRNAKGGKIDLFGSTGYHDETSASETAKEFPGTKTGDSKSSVMTQGAVTFGKDDLLPLLKEVYGIEMGEKGFIDLLLEGPGGNPLTIPADKPQIAMIPKMIKKGKAEGVLGTVLRNNPKFWVLIPAPVEEVVSEDEATLEIEEGVEKSALEV